MRRKLPICVLVLSVACLGRGVRAGDAGTVVFSSDDAGSMPKTVKAERGTIEVDLSSLGRDVAVYRAVLRPYGNINPRQGRDKPTAVKVSAGDSKEALPLLPPRYKGFVCTEAVAAAVKSGKGKLAFRVVSLPGYRGEGARLEVTCGVKAKAAIPRVKGIRAWHKSGQTFITWTEPDPPTTAKEFTATEYNALTKKLLAGKQKVAFRIYRHTAPITPGSIAQAKLVDEVGPLTCWNTEYRGKYTLRSKDGKVFRYVVRDGEGPVPPGTGIYAHNPPEAGRAWYAVSVAVNGAEDLSSFGEGNATAKGVDEVVGQGEPVCQRVRKPGQYKHHLYQKTGTLYDYTRWEAPPNCNLPSRPIDYLVGVMPKVPSAAPLALRLHGWGGSMHGGGFWVNPHKGTIMVSTNQLPYDWWTGFHEFSNTWRSWDEGAVHDYSQRRLLSFVDWVNTKWPVDMTRVSVGGGSMGGSGTTNLAVHHADRIAWAAGTVGVHIPDSSPQFTSSYIHCYGQVAWQLPYKDTGASAFNWFSNEWWVLNHPKQDLPLVCFSNGKNDGQIGWPQAVRFWRALQKARQPHVFKWGMGGHGEGVRVPTRQFKDAGGHRVREVIDARSDRTLPAFTACSLDGVCGNAIAKPSEQYEKEKAAVKAWNKENPKRRRHYDRYDGDQSGMSNGYLFWDADDKNVVDRPDKWSLTVWVTQDAPKDECTVNVTPRRCQRFKTAGGDAFTWTNHQAPRLAGGGEWKQVQSGTAKADKWGLVTLEKVKVTKNKNRIVIERK